MGKIISYILCIIAGMIIAGVISNTNKVSPNTTTILKTDTVVITKTDTITVTVTEWKTKTTKVIDTIIVRENTPIIIEQKKFSKEGVVDVWVSGYKTKIDSTKVYENTKTEIITTEKIKTNTEYYIGAGLIASQSNIIPHLDICMVTKKKNAYTLNIGIDNNEPFYGITFSKKIW